jgi:N-carbamoyl-L-amino-acid hydrolase
MGAKLKINGERLLRRLADFAQIGATEAGGVNRAAFSPEDRQARLALTTLAQGRGFEVRQDPAANLFIRFAGAGSVDPFLIGSHLDSQPTGGRFDGVLGTLAAFEVLETLDDGGWKGPIPVEVVVWSNEEGSRFAPGTMGSRAFATRRLPGNMSVLRDGPGKSLSAELEATLSALPQAALCPLGFPVSGYLELHIEQGPILDADRIAIGAVTSIQGTRWYEVTVTGETGHSGTTPLAARHDALATLVAALARLQASIMPGDVDARLTAGRMSVEPGSINAIPNRATATIDVRHPSVAKLEYIEGELRAAFSEAAQDAGCRVAIRRIFDMPPANFHGGLVDCIEQSAINLGLSARRMVSGAFHDALSMVPLAPSAMIFVPCRDGISHNEKEFVEPESCVAGASVLLEATIQAVERIAGVAILKSETENQKRMGT